MAGGFSSGTDFKVGDWLVRPRLARIERGDENVHVTPRAMAVLVHLASAEGDVVSRDALLDAVWPRMNVTQDALTQCVVELRKAFRDRSKNPLVIETIPKIGLRLIPRVSVAREPIAAANGHAHRVAESWLARRPARHVVVSVMFAICAIAGSGAWWIMTRSSAPASAVADDLDAQQSLARAHYESGNRYFNRNNERGDMVKLAARQYEIATEADPSFAPAWAQLGVARTALYFLNFDRTQAQLESAKAAIDAALRLDPDLPEAVLARANYLHRGLGDLEAALVEFDNAEQQLPDSAELYFHRASLQRSVGDWQSAERDLDRAVVIDPANVLYVRQQFVNHLLTLDYDRAEEYLDRVQLLAPDDAVVFTDRVLLALMRDGDTALAHRYERKPPADDYHEARSNAYARWLAAIFDREYRKASEMLDATAEDQVLDVDLGQLPMPKALFRARTLLLDGKPLEARSYFDPAESAIESELTNGVDLDTRTESFLCLALAEAQAALDRKREALDSMRRAQELLASTPNRPLDGSTLQLAAAIGVLVPSGEARRALDALDDYLGAPGAWAVEALARDPRLDAVTASPEFGALMEKHRRQ